MKQFNIRTEAIERMKLGISLQLGPQASPENLILVATRAEEVGYDSVWVLERLPWPLNPKEPSPPSPDGRLPESYQNVLDPLETLTFVAAHTKQVRLGTSVLVHSPPEIGFTDSASVDRALLRMEQVIEVSR